VNEAKDAVQSLLHAIFFQRNLGTIEPETKEVFDIHVVSLCVIRQSFCVGPMLHCMLFPMLGLTRIG
jgi:hypothetical protein